MGDHSESDVSEEGLAGNTIGIALDKIPTPLSSSETVLALSESNASVSVNGEATNGEATNGEAPTHKRRNTARRSLANTLSADVSTFALEDEASQEKYKTLSGFFSPDFPLSDLFTKHWVYLAALKHIGFLVFESVIVAGFGILYLYGLSAIPFTNDNTPNYYNPMLVAFFFFLVLFLVVVVIGYGFFVLLYGFHKSIPLLWWTVLPGTLASSIFLITTAAGVQPWFYALDLVIFGLLGVFFFNTVRVMANIVFPSTNDEDKQKNEAAKKELIMAYLVPLTIHTLIIALYNYVVIPYYRAFPNTDYYVWVRGIFRLIIHPILCQINLSVATFFCKEYPQVAHHLTVGVVFGVWVETAMLGRFLISTVGTTTGSLGTAAAVGVAEIAVRSFVKKKEHLVNYVLYRITKKVDWNEHKENAYSAQFNNNIMVVDFVSIIVIPFLLKFFYPHRLLFNFSYSYDMAPKTVDLATSAIAQFSIDFVVNFFCIIMESHLGIPDVKVWRRHRVVYIIWEVVNYIQIITLIVYLFKTLPATYFCDSVDPCSCRDTGYQSLLLFIPMQLCKNNTTS